METSRSSETLTPVDKPISTPTGSGYELIQGHRLYWECYGDQSDPVLVLLHHGLGSIRSWRRQIPAFVEGGWQVLVYDRWGYGRSDERQAFLHGYLAHDTDEAFGLLDRLGMNAVTLLGHSDGGSISLLMAAQKPQRINAMVVVAAHIYFEPQMLEGLEGIARIAQDSAFILGMRREHGERAERLVQAWIDHWQAPESQNLSMREALPAIECPTLVVQGELDEHAAPQHAIDIAEGIPGSTLWLVPDVQHMPPQEIPDHFNQKALEFLAN